jgi:hypothetical protein
MALVDMFTWLEAQPFAVTIAESPWMFPTIEVVHVTAIVLVVGSIAMLDLRLLGVSRRDYGVMELAEETLPWTWGAFVVAVLSGALMFSSAATKYFDNVPFREKMLLLLVAGVNMAIFHLTAYRSVHSWNHQLPTPRSARVAGTLSLCFWIGVVFFGRWIGFV